VDHRDPSGSERPARLRFVRVAVPLVQTHRSARSEEQVRDVVLVEWTRPDGAVGWGECPTLSGTGYVTGSTERAWRVLVTELGPAALGGGAALVADAMAPTGALADARLDAALRVAGRSLAVELGATRSSLPRCVVLADVGAAPDELARRATLAVRDGARMVKLKVAPGHDVEVVQAVRRALGPVPVAADANGAYPDPSALEELDRAGLAYLEQPFAPGAPWGEAAAQHRALRTPVALDESLTSPDAALDALRAGAVQVVSVKPARLGGVRAAAAVVAAAQDQGVPAFVGGMLELGIGRAGAAAVAALPGCTLPTDLGPSAAYVSSDVCDPLVLDAAGELVVPDGMGLGRVPDPARLAAVTVDEVVLGI
jgi:O-succinylbenzoate synthase